MQRIENQREAQAPLLPSEPGFVPTQVLTVPEDMDIEAQVLRNDIRPYQPYGVLPQLNYVVSSIDSFILGAPQTYKENIKKLVKGFLWLESANACTTFIGSPLTVGVGEQLWSFEKACLIGTPIAFMLISIPFLYCREGAASNYRFFRNNVFPELPLINTIFLLTLLSTLSYIFGQIMLNAIEFDHLQEPVYSPSLAISNTGMFVATASLGIYLSLLLGDIVLPIALDIIHDIRTQYEQVLSIESAVQMR